jgi:hypothetical protein
VAEQIAVDGVFLGVDAEHEEEGETDQQPPHGIAWLVERDHGTHEGEDRESGARCDAARRQLMI